jgi:putative ABC transport system permease protein
MSDDPARGRLRSLLVGSEVALALMLLAGAGLMINSFLRLTAVTPGFTAERALVLGLDLPGSRYPEAHQRRTFVDTLLARLESLPGVTAAGGTSNLPLGGTENWTPFSVVGRPEPPPGQGLSAAFRVVTTDYFRALQIPLRRGRFFEPADARQAVPLVRWFPQQAYPEGFERPQSPPVAIVSEEAARRFWPGEDPLGQRIRVLFSPEATVVGVVGDVRHTRLDLPIAPHIYLSHNQEPWGSLSVVIRTTGEPGQLSAAVREHVRALDARLPAPLRAMDDVLSASLDRPRFYTGLLGIFAAIALVLSAAGISSVVSYSAARRTREIGVRMALGAERGEVTRLVIAQGMRPVLGGLAAGLVGAFSITRFLANLLYGVEPGDPLTFAVVVGFLTTVALVACWVPAYRASRLDPLAALRTE